LYPVTTPIPVSWLSWPQSDLHSHQSTTFQILLASNLPSRHHITHDSAMRIAEPTLRMLLHPLSVPILTIYPSSGQFLWHSRRAELILGYAASARDPAGSSPSREWHGTTVASPSHPVFALVLRESQALCSVLFHHIHIIRTTLFFFALLPYRTYPGAGASACIYILLFLRAYSEFSPQQCSQCLYHPSLHTSLAIR